MARTTINDLERQLNELKAHLGQHGDKADEILREVKNLQPGQFDLYSDAFGTGLPSVTGGVIDLVALGRDGNPYAISIASLSIFSGFLTMAGPAMGPVGPLVSALTGLLSAILGQFLPAGKSLQQEIKEAFQKFEAGQNLMRLSTASNAIWVLANTIEKKSPTPWKPFDLVDGQEVTAIDDAWYWLSEEENQSHSQWGIVLEKTCLVFTQLLRLVTLANSHPSTDPTVQKEAMLQYVSARMELFLGYLEDIMPAARKRGMFWHLGATQGYSYLEEGAVYTCDSIFESPEWRKLGGSSRVMTVASNQGKEGFRPYPLVTLLTLEPPRDSAPGPMDDAAGFMTYNKNHPFKPNERAYGVTGAWPPPAASWPQLTSNDSSHPLEGCYDIYAVPADDRYPGGIFFYTANGNEIRGYIQDKDGKVSFAWSYPVADGRKVGSIRVVSNLKGFADDPDENREQDPRVLEEIAWVMYGGCEVSGGMDILVRFADKKAVVNEGYLRAPWPNLRGIGADRGYLWVYRAGDIACATHTSIRKALQKKAPQPSWMTYQGFPKSVVENLYVGDKSLGGLVDLSPCEDGTLVATFAEGPWRGNVQLKSFMLIPHIDRPKRTLTFDFVRIPREGGFRVHKQPLFCWSLLEELTATLEEQTATPRLEAVAAEVQVRMAAAAP